MLKIKDIKIRKILNSGGKLAIESSVILNKNIVGIASAPSAIIAGKREVFSTNITDDYNVSLNNLIIELKNTKKIIEFDHCDDDCECHTHCDCGDDHCHTH